MNVQKKKSMYGTLLWFEKKILQYGRDAVQQP